MNEINSASMRLLRLVILDGPGYRRAHRPDQKWASCYLTSSCLMLTAARYDYTKIASTRKQFWFFSAQPCGDPLVGRS